MTAIGASGGMGEWRAHWPIVVPGMLGIMLASTHGYTLGVMIRPLEAEFGWPRAQISGGMLIVSVVALIVSPLVGTAVDRFGARRIALFGVPFYCAALALLSAAGADAASWWLLWLLLALANMTILPVVWLAAINGYFDRSRGLAMAVCLSGTGAAAAVMPFLANTLLEWQGWRGAYLALGALTCAVCLPLTWLLFHPAQKPAPAAKGEGRPQPAGASAGAQAKSLRFFKLAAASLIFAGASCALTTNFVPVLIGEGLSPASAAATAGLMGLGAVVGRLSGGILLDRFNANIVAAVSVLVPIVPIAILLATDGSQLWAAAACLVMGLSIGAELDANAYLVSRHFGTRNFGALFGTINGLLLFGAGLAPLLANYSYDVTRSYDLVLLLLIPLCLVTSVLFLTLGRYPAAPGNAAGAPPAQSFAPAALRVEQGPSR